MDTTPALTDLLKRVTAFGELDDATLRLLETKMMMQVYKAGEDLCQEGDLGDRMFVLESGQVSVLKHSEEGAIVEVAVLQAGEIAGEMSVYGQTVRSATLRATKETRAWVLDHATFQTLLEHHGTLARAILAGLSRHLRRETSVVAKLLSQDLDRRFKVAFFDAKPYMEAAFRERNRYDYAIHFFESRLSVETVSLAAGFKVVCVFVNDLLNAAVIEELHTLGVEMIALRCAGYNNVDLAAGARLGLTVAHVPAYSPYAVAEHSVALMLALNRRIHQAHGRVREGNFSLNGLVGFDLHGKTAGVVGTGKIGKGVLSILAGFGCRLLAYDTYQDRAFAEKLGFQYVDLETLIPASDIISLHAPLTPQTHHLVDAAAIAKMKRGVMLINTSRGALVDTRALLEGLKSGQIGYAGLDVYEEESGYFYEDLSDRVITDDVLARLMTFNNVLVTSHQAFLTREALANIAETTLENIREFQTGKRLRELTHAVSAPA